MTRLKAWIAGRARNDTAEVSGRNDAAEVRNCNDAIQSGVIAASEPQSLIVIDKEA
jgi:hypothetical protein